MIVTYKNGKMVVITGRGSDQYTSAMLDGRISVSTEFDKVKSRSTVVDVSADGVCEKNSVNKILL